MDTRPALAGNLAFITLADVFQILGGNSSTGILRIISQYAPEPGLIYFIKGDLINATLGPQSGIDAVYSLFGWAEGTFEFHEQEVYIKRAITRGRMEIVLDAMRMLDDGLIKKVGPVSLNKASSKETARVGSERKRVIEGPLVDYTYVLNEESYRDGEKIVNEGGHGKWIWVILKGSVIVERETSKGFMTIARLGRGCFIGTFTALTFMEHSRSTTIGALGDVRLGLLDTELLHREFSSLSVDFRGFLLSLDRRLQTITDKACDLFVDKGKSLRVPRYSKEVVEKGSSKGEIFTVVEGEAYVIGQTRKGVLPLITLKKDDIFGDIPFMDLGHEPRYASVLGSKDLKINKLDPAHLQNEYDQLSDTIKNMIYVTCTCIFSTTRLVSTLYGGK
jgi:hypothetical protein